MLLPAATVCLAATRSLLDTHIISANGQGSRFSLLQQRQEVEPGDPWLKQEALACLRRHLSAIGARARLADSQQISRKSTAICWERQRERGRDEGEGECADTMHMYYATWIGRLQHGRASIYLALLLLPLPPLLLPLPPLPPPGLTSATPYVAPDRWPFYCWKADAGFSLWFLKYLRLITCPAFLSGCDWFTGACFIRTTIPFGI